MMTQTPRYDLVIIGGGPAGYVGAIRAAQLGLSTLCIEKGKLGGTCLNLGCIPTKALLAAAEFYDKLKHDAARWGIYADNVNHDWPTLITHWRTIAANLNKGISALLKKNKITHLQGTAKIIAPGKIDVAGQPVEARHIIIATGARPRPLPGVAFDQDKIITSSEAMTMSSQPKRLIIVGAGAIGMEFAYFYHTFGTEVVMVEMLDHLLPNEDKEVSRAMEKAWRKQKIQTHVKTKTLAVCKTDQGVELTIAPVDKALQTTTLTGDKVLIAVGVTGNHQGVFDTSLDIQIVKDHIQVDRNTYQTGVPGIYAVGDVIGPPWLAHVASEEAVVCVEKIAGHDGATIDYDAIPACTYCHPQVASLGLTEQACEQRNQSYRVGRFPFQASGKAQAIGQTQGFVKILTDTHSNEILGVHMVGGNVTELLAELGLAKRLEATTQEVIATLHAHPTLSEAVHEAAMGAAGTGESGGTGGRMIHF